MNIAEYRLSSVLAKYLHESVEQCGTTLTGGELTVYYDNGQVFKIAVKQVGGE